MVDYVVTDARRHIGNAGNSDDFHSLLPRRNRFGNGGHSDGIGSLKPEHPNFARRFVARTCQTAVNAAPQKIFGRLFFTGFRFNTYQSTSVCNGWFKGPLSVDKDNFYYYPTYEADFIEENKISTLSIPIAYQFTTNQNKPSHFSFELGILNNFLLDNSIEIDGFYELRGMYPDAVYYNVFHLIEQSFQYGYSRYAPQRKYQVLKSFFISTYCGIGFTSSISNRVSLFTQLRYQLSLGDVINKKKQDIDYVDLTGYQSNYQKTNLKGMGFECGLSIRLNSKKGNRL